MSAQVVGPNVEQKSSLDGLVVAEVRPIRPSLRRLVLLPALWSFGVTIVVLAFSFGTYALWENLKNGYSYHQIVSSDLPVISSSGNSLTSEQPASPKKSTSPSTSKQVASSGTQHNSSSGGGSDSAPITPPQDPSFKGIEVPSSIVADCSVNVSAELNAWLAGVPDGSTIGFNGGCFRIDQTLFLKNRNDLVVDGQGATFRAVSPTGDSSTLSNPSRAARTRSQWSVSGSSNVTFRNMTVYGANPNGGTGSAAYVAALEAQHAFNIDGGNTNITIHDAQAYDTYGDFIYFRGTANGYVYNCHFERNGRQGISVTGGGPILIEDNYIANTRRATIDLEPNTSSAVVGGVTIRDNTIGAGRLLFVAAHGSGPVNNIVIENNKLTRCMSISVQGSASLRRHDWTVQNNTTTGGCGSPGPGSPIFFGYVDHIRVLNNVQPIQKNRGDNGVDISNVTDIQVNGNSFPNAVAALYGYGDWVGDSNYSACGNQLASEGAYDQPTACD